MHSLPPPDPRRALAHPLWVLSLAALVVNDHALKGSGLAPSWLTGKLSDVAGLVVAPVLVAALAGARTRRGLALAFAPVALAFAAIKVSPAASELYVRAHALFGAASRNVCDPTDLVGLAALPVAWWLCTQRPAATRRRMAPAAQRLAVAIAGLACVATSPAPPPPGVGSWFTRGWIANTTDVAVEIRLRWVSGPHDCDARVQWPRVLARSSFNATPITVRLGPRQNFPLDRLVALTAIGGLTQGNNFPDGTSGCDAVLLQADNLPSTVLRWSGPQTSVGARYDANMDAASGGYLLSGTATALRVTPTSTRAEAFAPADERPVCDEGGAFVASLDVSQWSSPRRVTRVSRLADGCTRVEASDQRAILCVPEESVALREGDEVTATSLASEGVRFRVTGGATMSVYTGAATVPELSATGVRCEGHTACGAYVLRHGATALGSRQLAPGERAESGQTRVWFGRAERAVVQPDACNAAGVSPLTRSTAEPIRYHAVVVQGG